VHLDVFIEGALKVWEAFLQGAYAAVPGTQTQLLQGFWLSPAFQY